MNLLFFLLGFMIGSGAGIMTMCLVQINRDTEEELRREELKRNEKEK